MTISLPVKQSDPIQTYLQILEGTVPTQVALQPIVRLADAVVFGYEVLARWPGFSPDEAFSLAYQYRGVEGLESRLVRAIHDLRTFVPEMLFVNVHPSVPNPELWRSFRQRRVILEVTEAEPVNFQGVAELRQMGFSLALDDLGTGHATFDTLLQLRPEFIKLDKVLTQSVHLKARNSLMKAMVDYARQSGSQAIAEGIETKEQLQAAIDAGCHFGQGYLLGKPKLILCAKMNADM